MSELALSLDAATLDILALKVAEHLATLSPSGESPEGWMDSLAAAKFIGYPMNTESERRKARKRMSEHVRSGRITCGRDGERLLFKRQDLDSYLAR